MKPKASNLAANPEPPTPPASVSGSASVETPNKGPEEIALWFRYLESTGNLERYDGTCKCYVCRQIAADFEPWKATSPNFMSDIRTRLLKCCLKPEEIASFDVEIKNARVVELVNWMARYGEGHANPKWLSSHAAELAHYVAELKGL